MSYYFPRACNNLVHIQWVPCTKTRFSITEDGIFCDHYFPPSSKNLWVCHHNLRSILYIAPRKTLYLLPFLNSIVGENWIKHLQLLRQMSVYLGGSRKRRKDFLSPFPSPPSPHPHYRSPGPSKTQVTGRRYSSFWMEASLFWEPWVPLQRKLE